MSDKERLEMLWCHYHSQVDENRAVCKILDEMRERIKELENVIATRAVRPHQCNQLV